jgi:Domain of unknown function (DUF3291)
MVHRTATQDFHLAQLNIATLLAPLDDPRLAEFVANLDRINELAEAAPGFVWRLKGEGNDATSLRPFGENVIVNMSVWKDADRLFDFVYRTAHAPVMAKRRQWFAKPEGPFVALWWISAGHRPTIEEARQRPALLARKGPSPGAFTFKQRFPAPVGSAVR